MAKDGEQPLAGGDDLAQFYGGTAPGNVVVGDDSDSGGGSGGGSSADSGSGGGSGDGGAGRVDPRSAFDTGNGGGTGVDSDDGDDLYIRDAAGNILLSPTGRKRRRRRGTAARSPGVKEKATKLSVSSVEAILLSSHQMLAQLTNVQSLDIGKHKADMLATGIVNVARHYPTGALDPKMVDWFNLFMALGICYQPVAAEVRDNIRAKNADKRGSGRTNGTQVAVTDEAAPVRYDQAPVFDGPLDLSTIQKGPIRGE